MKISTNNIGNYTINNSASVSQIKKQPAVKTQPDVLINDNEREYFRKLYPAQQNEISNYHFYGKSGKMSGVALGQNLDRRF